MSVTECSIGMQNMIPEEAREVLMQHEALGSNAITQLRSLAGLCNAGEFNATTSKRPLQERKINGDATDQAMLRFSESLGLVSELRQMWRRTFELAFSSKNKYMIRTFKLAEREGLNHALSAIEASSFQSEDT